MRRALGFLALALLVVGEPVLAATRSVPTPDLQVPDPLEMAGNKVSVCHNDIDDDDPDRDAVTINVSESSLDKHLAHGDCYYESFVPSGDDCTLDDPDANDICGDQSV
jgi:hypothetical protein